MLSAGASTGHCKHTAVRVTAAGDLSPHCLVNPSSCPAAAVLSESKAVGVLCVLVPVGREQLESSCFHCHLCFSDIFREFNVTIVGYSTGTGSENDSNAFLNQAVPGAQAEYVAFCFTFVGDGCFI